MNDKNQYLMALDFGTGAGRCFLISADGETSWEKYQEWAYQYPAEAQPGGSEFDPQEFWSIFAGLIKAVIAEAGIQPDQIAGISSTAQREGVVFLDKNGRELYAGPNLDMRAPSNAAEFTEKFGEKLHHISGHWPFPMFAPYRLLWFKEHKPEIYSQIDSVLLLNNWILYKLCGEKATEPSNGVETLLVDMNTRTWDFRLIEEMGFRPEIFPEVYESGTVIGKVTPEAAESTGLVPGIPVVLGGADTQCALLGTSALQPGDLGVPLGTFGPVQLVVDHPILAEPELIWSGCHTVPQYWVIESTSMEVGQTFRYVRDTFYTSDTMDTYQVMNEEASQSPVGANGVRAYLGPRLPNYRNLQFVIPGGFKIQLPPSPGTATRGDYARAALEAVAYGVKLNVDRLQRVSGQDLSVLRVSGGLAKSRLLRHLLADLIGVRITVPIDKEASALGAAICAGVGAGIFPDMAKGAARLVRWEETLDPDPEKQAQYETLFQAWKADYHKMYGEDTLLE